MMALGCVVPDIWGNARHPRGSPLQKLAKERCFSGIIFGLLNLAGFRLTSGGDFCYYRWCGLGLFGARGLLVDGCTE
jgi:hypothetical protein